MKDAKAFLREPQVFFDVGAGAGGATARMRAAFPTVRICAFEPLPPTYQKMKQAVADDPLAQAFCLGLSDTVGEVWTIVPGAAPAYRVAAEGAHQLPSNLRPPDDGVRMEMTTGDIFCAEHGIERISYLKAETEGHDFHVLRGFRAMITSGRIDMIEVEAGIYPGNSRATDLTRFRDFLEPYGYWIRHIHNQVLEEGQPYLGRCNPVFVGGCAAPRLL